MQARFPAQRMLLASATLILAACFDNPLGVDRQAPGRVGALPSSAALDVTSTSPAAVVLHVTPRAAILAAGTGFAPGAALHDAAGSVVASAQVVWAISDPTIATISTAGELAGVRPGTVSVIATADGRTDTLRLEVMEAAPAPLVVAPHRASMTAGSQLQLRVRSSSKQKLVGRRAVAWSTSDPAAVTVSADGVVSAVAPGAATITARSDRESATTAIEVLAAPAPPVVTEPAPAESVPPPAEPVSVPTEPAPEPAPVETYLHLTPQTATLAPGQTQQFTASVTDAAGNAVAGVTIAWASSDPSRASVSAAGLVTANVAGTATITATGDGKSQSATVTVTSVSTPSGILIRAGESIQAAVNAHPAGTQFVIGTGTHRNQSVVPKSGQAFVGERGAVLDGGGVTKYAFTVASAPYPSDVLIQGLVIRNYAPDTQMGAIRAGGHDAAGGSRAWVVADNEIAYNATGGVRLGHTMRLLRNRIHHNGQIGVTGIGDSVLVEGNEIAYNNYERRFDPGWEAGGTKFVETRGLVVRSNFVHHNEGPGLWTDINNIYTLYENNRVEDNAEMGIFHEISYDAVIRHNVVRRNGFGRGDAQYWPWGAGITVAASPNVEVYGNVVEDNRHGIVGLQQNRGTGKYGAYLVQNLWVHDNDVQMSVGLTGAAQDTGDDAVFTSRNNRFQNNRYRLGTNPKYFTWMNGDRTEAEWRGYGHDVTGSFQR